MKLQREMKLQQHSQLRTSTDVIKGRPDVEYLELLLHYYVILPL